MACRRITSPHVVRGSGELTQAYPGFVSSLAGDSGSVVLRVDEDVGSATKRAGLSAGDDLLP